MAKAKKVKSAKASKAEVKKSADKKPRTVAKPFRIIGRIFWPLFIRNSVKELKMVTWPGWKTGRQLTVAVLIFAIIFAVAVALVDWGLDHAFKALFLK